MHIYAFYVHKKDSIFMRIKTSNKKKVACLMFCAFCDFCAFYALYMHKKRLSESHLFAFCAFCSFCAYKKCLRESRLFAFCAFFAFFVCVKSFREKKTKKNCHNTLIYITTLGVFESFFPKLP